MIREDETLTITKVTPGTPATPATEYNTADDVHGVVGADGVVI
jgi:hypothetical protein